MVEADITVEVSSSKSVSGGEGFFGFLRALLRGGSADTTSSFSILDGFWSFLLFPLSDSGGGAESCLNPDEELAESLLVIFS